MIIQPETYFLLSGMDFVIDQLFLGLPNQPLSSVGLHMAHPSLLARICEDLNDTTGCLILLSARNRDIDIPARLGESPPLAPGRRRKMALNNTNREPVSLGQGGSFVLSRPTQSHNLARMPEGSLNLF